MSKYLLEFKDDSMYFYVSGVNTSKITYDNISICRDLFTMAKELKALIVDMRLCCKSIIEYNEQYDNMK